MIANVSRVPRSIVLCMLVATIASGCKSTGLGAGQSPKGDVHATFQWESLTPTSGTLRAALVTPNGAPETYAGKFFQITRETTLETVGPLWDPWYPAWGGWRYWGAEPEIAFLTHYTGHVVANLEGPANKRMRCEFQLVNASAGMKGGGKGECQLASGETIKAEFPPS